MLKTTCKSVSSSNKSSRVLAALRAGIDPGRLTWELATQHPGDAGFARRLVDTASARFWLADGVLLADVLVLLELCHRFMFSPAEVCVYAVELLWTAQHRTEAINPDSIPTAKENRYAIA